MAIFIDRHFNRDSGFITILLMCDWPLDPLPPQTASYTIKDVEEISNINAVVNEFISLIHKESFKILPDPGKNIIGQFVVKVAIKSSLPEDVQQAIVKEYSSDWLV